MTDRYNFVNVIVHKCRTVKIGTLSVHKTCKCKEVDRRRQVK